MIVNFSSYHEIIEKLKLLKIKRQMPFDFDCFGNISFSIWHIIGEIHASRVLKSYAFKNKNDCLDFKFEILNIDDYFTWIVLTF